MSPDGSPARRGRGASWGLTVAALSGVALVMRMASSMSARAEGSGGERLGAEAAVVRGGRRVAPIERVIRARGRGRLPQYLAPAAGPVIDSARVGALAARLRPGARPTSDPVVALVPRDSVAGLALVGRLVVTPGEPGLLIFGTPGGRP